MKGSFIVLFGFIFWKIKCKFGAGFDKEEEEVK
jgi:hypothetical protein